MNRFLLFCLAAVCPLLLPACGVWCIGERIRYDSERHVGAAIYHASVHYHPAAEVAEQKAAPGNRMLVGARYVLAPEVTYRVRHPLVYTIWADGETVTDVMPTGRMLLVNLHGLYREGTWQPGRVETLPEGLEGVPQSVSASPPWEYKYATSLGEFDSPLATRGSLGAQLAAAPFDYLIDPALSAVSVTASVCAGVAITPFWIVWWLVDEEASPPWGLY